MNSPALARCAQYVRSGIGQTLLPRVQKDTTPSPPISRVFITGYGGVVAPPFQRFYMGGEYDLRGFDIRSAFPSLLPDQSAITLVNPDGPERAA